MFRSAGLLEPPAADLGEQRRQRGQLAIAPEEHRARPMHPTSFRVEVPR
jgi:hypothetical protein